MPAKNPNRERAFSLRDMINNSPDTQRQKQLISQETDEHLKIRNINVEDIIFNKNNSIFNSDDTEEDIASLAESIQAYGLLHPINVVKEGNKYLLLDGERRTKAFQHLHKRKIPGFVYDNLEDYKQRGILYHANLLSRNLDDRKRFLAFKELRDYYANLDEKMKKSAIEKEISNLLGIAVRSVQRLERILKSANEDDLMLLEEGKISYTEFKERTYKLIAEQTKMQEERLMVLSKKVEYVKYIDKNTDTVYFVSNDTDDNSKYCTFITNKNVYMVGFHTPALPTRNEKSRAQVDLYIVASHNSWDIYNGDLSEYKNTVAAVKSDDNALPISKSNSDTENVTVQSIETVSTENDNITSQAGELSSTFLENATEEQALDITSVPSESELKQNIETPLEEHESNEVSTSESNDQPEASDIDVELSSDITTFFGYTIASNERVDGPLWISPNGKAYILRNINSTGSISPTKVGIQAIAEEVDPRTIQRLVL